MDSNVGRSDRDETQLLTRRGFLKGAAVVSAGIGVPLLAAACVPSTSAPSAPPTPSGAVPSAGASVADVERPVEFQAWSYQPDKIQEHLTNWTKQSTIPVNLSLLPNVGYTPAIQTRLQGGALIDVFYNFAYNTGKFVKQGWARDLSDLPGVDEILEDMSPSARPQYLLPNGDVISMPYFSTANVQFFNKAHLASAGFPEPQTMAEVYDQSKVLKESGVSKYPYLGYWIKEFCEEYFNSYLIAEGVTIWGDSGEPAFADDPQSTTVFEWWNALYQDGLTSPTILSDDPSKLMVFMGTGESTFFVMHHNILRAMHNLEDAAEKDNIDVQYRFPGTTGKAFMLDNMIQMGTQATGSSMDNAWDLMKFYGWKDNNGEYATFRSWAQAGALAAPYPDFWKDPAVIEAYTSFGFDVPKTAELFDTGSVVVPQRNLAWYPTFQVNIGDRIHAMLLGQASPSETVKALAADALAAQAAG